MNLPTRGAFLVTAPGWPKPRAHPAQCDVGHEGLLLGEKAGSGPFA